MLSFIPAADPRLSYFAPQPVDRSGETVRISRFPQAAYDALAGQIGPTANLRSSAGCALLFETDSPLVELHLERLRHHQPTPQGVALEVEQPDGSCLTVSSTDLRELSGAVQVPLPTGLERGDLRPVRLWLPLISTCEVRGIAVVPGSSVEPLSPPEPRWLALGDSLTQGFSVQCPTQNWVHRLSRRWGLPVWNLGVGGLQVEPEALDWALGSHRWELVTIGLGSNHAWREPDAELAGERAEELVRRVLAGEPGRVVWLLPGYKPLEEGKGPPDFAGVFLNQAAADRLARIRQQLEERLSRFPEVEVVGGLAPRDARLYPDGLHPSALGFARYAENLDRALRGAE
ncbi:MAG: SGNH/GDSL hydrolase family protein [Armatimonadota bacterium]